MFRFFFFWWAHSHCSLRFYWRLWLTLSCQIFNTWQQLCHQQGRPESAPSNETIELHYQCLDITCWDRTVVHTGGLLLLLLFFIWYFVWGVSPTPLLKRAFFPPRSCGDDFRLHDGLLPEWGGEGVQTNQRRDREAAPTRQERCEKGAEAAPAG